MKNITHWHVALRWILAAFFVFGGIGNIIAPEPIASDYIRWGYPDWFHFVTGGMELVAAVLLLSKARLYGAFLAVGIMLGAVGTLIIHQEYSHAIAPLTVLALTTLLIWALKR